MVNGKGRDNADSFNGSCTLELSETFSEAIRIRPVQRAMRQHYSPSIELLEAMQKHGAVVFLQNVFPNMHVMVLVDADDVLIIGGMMDLTQRETIVYHRDTRFF